MPRHYAQGVNIQQGRVRFNNSRFMKIYYSLTFTRRPFVKISPEETEELPPYRLYVTKTYFRIRFATPYTGTVIWEASL